VDSFFFLLKMAVQLFFEFLPFSYLLVPSLKVNNQALLIAVNDPLVWAVSVGGAIRSQESWYFSRKVVPVLLAIGLV